MRYSLHLYSGFGRASALAFVRPLSYFNPSERGALHSTREIAISRCGASRGCPPSPRWRYLLSARVQGGTLLFGACSNDVQKASRNEFLVEKELMNLPNRRMKIKNMKTLGTSLSLALKFQLTEFQFPLTSRRSHSGGMWKTGQIISNRSISTRFLRSLAEGSRERLPD